MRQGRKVKKWEMFRKKWKKRRIKINKIENRLKRKEENDTWTVKHD